MASSDEQVTIPRVELEAILERLERLERAMAATPTPDDPTRGRRPTVPTDPSDRPTGASPVDRRALLRGGGIAAGVVAAGAAAGVMGASPAAAATLSGSGNPGVAADGIGGDGVDATTDTAGASAVYGATSVGMAALRGIHSGSGAGVWTTSATGRAIEANGGGDTVIRAVHGSAGFAVWGITAGTALRGESVGSGIAVHGTSNATMNMGTGVRGEGGWAGVVGATNEGVGVRAESSGPAALRADNYGLGDGALARATGTGVRGVTLGGAGGVGVSAEADHADAVALTAANPSGTALKASTGAGTLPAVAVKAGPGGGIDALATDGYAAVLTGGGSAAGAALRLTPVAPDPGARTGTHLRGELVEDTNGDLWLCTDDGAPGTWRKLGGPATTGALHLLPTPVRVFDSRAGFAPANVAKGAFANQTKPIDATNNASGVPAGATGVLVNFAVTNTVNGGYGTLWTNGAPWPGTANLNWSATATSISNSVATAVDADAILQCKIAGVADVVIDVIGYWR